MNINNQHTYWMQEAIKLAYHANHQGEVPIGAVVVLDDNIIGQGWNQPISANDPTAHAEIIAMRAAAQYINNYRLLNTTLYVTLEPCAMCVGAMIHARIKRLIFGVYDPKGGAVCSVFKLLDEDDDNKFNHRILYHGGIMANECGTILADFFAARR